MTHEKIVEAEIVTESKNLQDQLLEEKKKQEEATEKIKTCANKLQDCLTKYNCKLSARVVINAQKATPQVLILLKENDDLSTYTEEQNKTLLTCKQEFEQILNDNNCGVTAEMIITEKGNNATVFYFLKK